MAKFGERVQPVWQRSADEADIQSGLLSITAPLARALIGKTVGDSVEVNTPGGARSYEVIRVKFK